MDKKKNQIWLCRCDCGTEKLRRAVSLKTGDSRSCGCVRTGKTRKESEFHGMSRCRGRLGIYGVWNSMIQRCENEKNPKFEYYGGRGIRVCDAWRLSFLQFYNDVGDRPDMSYELDRINNNGNYEPGNVRWTSHRTNSINRRDNVWYKLNEEIVCQKEFSDRTGISESKLIRSRK